MATMEHYPVGEEGTGGTPLKLFVGQVRLFQMRALLLRETCFALCLGSWLL